MRKITTATLWIITIFIIFISSAIVSLSIKDIVTTIKNAEVAGKNTTPSIVFYIFLMLFVITVILPILFLSILSSNKKSIVKTSVALLFFLISIIALLCTTCVWIIIRIQTNNISMNTNNFIDNIIVVGASPTDKKIGTSVGIAIIILISILFIAILTLVILLLIKFNKKQKKLNKQTNSKLNINKSAMNNNTKKKLHANKKQFSEIENIKQEVLNLQEQVNNDNYDMGDFIKPEVLEESKIISKSIKSKDNIKNQDSSVTNEDYKKLLENLKKTKEKDEKKLNNNLRGNYSYDMTSNASYDKTKQIRTNKTEEEINKIQIFLPKSNRNKNIDVYKLKKDIYYNNNQKQLLDNKKIEEIHNKYENNISVGESENIWEVIQKNKNNNNHKNVSDDSKNDDLIKNNEEFIEEQKLKKAKNLEEYLRQTQEEKNNK